MWSFTRLTFALLCVVVLAHGAADVTDATEPNCAQYFLPACTRELNEVCGTDGETYGNECMLCLHNSENMANVFIQSEGPC